jgi:hypothetical protein
MGAIYVTAILIEVLETNLHRKRRKPALHKNPIITQFSVKFPFKLTKLMGLTGIFSAKQQTSSTQGG